MQINHINISAPIELIEQEKTFFCQILGLKEGFRPEFSRKGYWLYDDDKAIVHLTESDKHFNNKKQGHLDHIAFQTVGLQDFVTRLKKHNIVFSTDYIEELTMTQLFLKSPSAVGIELTFFQELL